MAALQAEGAATRDELARALAAEGAAVAAREAAERGAVVVRGNTHAELTRLDEAVTLLAGRLLPATPLPGGTPAAIKATAMAEAKSEAKGRKKGGATPAGVPPPPPPPPPPAELALPRKGEVGKPAKKGGKRSGRSQGEVVEGEGAEGEVKAAVAAAVAAAAVAAMQAEAAAQAAAAQAAAQAQAQAEAQAVAAAQASAAEMAARGAHAAAWWGRERAALHAALGESEGALVSVEAQLERALAAARAVEWERVELEEAAVSAARAAAAGAARRASLVQGGEELKLRRELQQAHGRLEAAEEEVARVSAHAGGAAGAADMNSLAVREVVRAAREAAVVEEAERNLRREEALRQALLDAQAERQQLPTHVTQAATP